MGDTLLLLDCLAEIAKRPRGGVIVAGTSDGDRDLMIGAARQTLMKYTGQGTYQRAAFLVEGALKDRRKTTPT